MKIIDLIPEHRDRLDEAAALLLDGFSDTGSAAWSTHDAARREVEESLQADRISRVALDDGDHMIGWIGGISAYDGYAWELHPMVVRRGQRRRGIGRALVSDLEDQVRRRGGMTIYLGTDDENGRTSLGGVDLYPDVLGALRTMQNLRDHPFDFYQRVGFAIVGVIPDANGFGKPDILMAKRVASSIPLQSVSGLGGPTDSPRRPR
jgi:aminoglycoside 6'-N-acetyltransferase I